MAMEADHDVSVITSDDVSEYSNRYLSSNVSTWKRYITESKRDRQWILQEWISATVFWRTRLSRRFFRKWHQAATFSANATYFRHHTILEAALKKMERRGRLIVHERELNLAKEAFQRLRQQTLSSKAAVLLAINSFQMKKYWRALVSVANFRAVLAPKLLQFQQLQRSRTVSRAFKLVLEQSFHTWLYHTQLEYTARSLHSSQRKRRLKTFFACWKKRRGYVLRVLAKDEDNIKSLQQFKMTQLFAFWYKRVLLCLLTANFERDQRLHSLYSCFDRWSQLTWKTKGLASKCAKFLNASARRLEQAAFFTLQERSWHLQQLRAFRVQRSGTIKAAMFYRWKRSHIKLKIVKHSKADVHAHFQLWWDRLAFVARTRGLALAWETFMKYRGFFHQCRRVQSRLAAARDESDRFRLGLKFRLWRNAVTQHRSSVLERIAIHKNKHKSLELHFAKWVGSYKAYSCVLRGKSGRVYQKRLLGFFWLAWKAHWKRLQNTKLGRESVEAPHITSHLVLKNSHENADVLNPLHTLNGIQIHFYSEESLTRARSLEFIVVPEPKSEEASEDDLYEPLLFLSYSRLRISFHLWRKTLDRGKIAAKTAAMFYAFKQERAAFSYWKELSKLASERQVWSVLIRSRTLLFSSFTHWGLALRRKRQFQAAAATRNNRLLHTSYLYWVARRDLYVVTEFAIIQQRIVKEFQVYVAQWTNLLSRSFRWWTVCFLRERESRQAIASFRQISGQLRYFGSWTARLAIAASNNNAALQTATRSRCTAAFRLWAYYLDRKRRLAGRLRVLQQQSLHFTMWKTQRIFARWRRRYAVERNVFFFHKYVELRFVKRFFLVWKAGSDKRLFLNTLFALSCGVRRRAILQKRFQEWRHRNHTLLLLEQLQKQRKRQTARHLFAIWKAEVQAREQRRHRLTTHAFACWKRCAVSKSSWQHWVVSSVFQRWKERAGRVDTARRTAVQHHETTLVRNVIRYWLDNVRLIRQDHDWVATGREQGMKAVYFHRWLDKVGQRNDASLHLDRVKKSYLKKVFRYWRSRVASRPNLDLARARFVVRFWRKWAKSYDRIAFDTARKMVFAETWYEKQYQRKLLLAWRRLVRNSAQIAGGMKRSVLAGSSRNLLGSNFTLIRINPQIK
ncbi:hypothetical protein HDV03_005007 [Kappamyces sp. JEL0829]|nr:hypothetical protein HDV03_005007 [Kappamyces sp. JEL0829]